MKRLAVLFAMSLFLFIATTGVMAIDTAAISSNVENTVAALDAGKDAASFAADEFDPYVFILKEDGSLVVHPSLAGASLKEKAPPVYEALVKADPHGGWIQYEWKGKTKNTFAKRTKDNLIVGSGY